MIVIGSKSLELADIQDVVFNGVKIKLDTNALEKASISFNYLGEFSKKSIIYGVNTGFGPMAQYRISEDEQKQLQYNLIRSHASGAGKMIPLTCIKAMMLARINSLMQGVSAIHSEVLQLLVEFINQDIYPEIPTHGGVGASGDLVQLAHLALALIGEGNAWHSGSLKPMKDIMAELNLKPSGIHLREGLGIMNGTSAMTGIGTCNIILAKRLTNWSVLASSMINELVGSFDDHYSKELNQVKRHKGQQQVAKAMRDILESSKLIRKRSENLYNKEFSEDVFIDKVQEYYSLRCVPQILGPVLDTLLQSQEVLENELNSANDNPIVDVDNDNIFHGGNFHGDYVSLEMDKVKIAVTKLSMLAERQINFLMNHNLNGKFPPFLNLGKLGFNFGMQGVQFTATSTVAENQSLCFPNYVHSIPNNNDNQDIVSMGANSAMLTRKVVINSFEVLAIEFMSIMQAVRFVNSPDKMSLETKNTFDDFQKVFPTFVDDSVKYEDIRKVKEYLMENDPGYFS
jgi:histidine ammonia-lyase